MSTNNISVKHVLTSKHAPDGSQRFSFWAPELAQARKAWFKLVLLTLGLTIIFMFALLACYFGSYYDQISRATYFSIEVLDLDSLASPFGSSAHPAILGPSIRSTIQSDLASSPRLGWYLADNTTLRQFQLTSGGQGVVPIDYARRKVLNQDVWGVLVVNANATSGVWEALTSGTEWDPTGALTFVYEEARNFYGTDQYVSRLAIQLLTIATSSASTTLASQVLALSNASAVISAAPSGSLIGSFSYNMHNLRPFDELAGIAATTVGTIYLIIFTFLISVSWNTRGMVLIQDKLVISSEIAIKLGVPIVLYLWLSLNYSLVSLAFKVTFDRFYGRIGFVIYWMSNWVGMSALGYVMETCFLWFGPFFPFFLIFWVIMNVSVAFLDISDMQTFYRYGYIVPVWNVVDTSKSIIFGTKNHLPQNFLVCIGWLVVWACLLCGTVVYQRKKKESAKVTAQMKESKERK